MAQFLKKKKCIFGRARVFVHVLSGKNKDNSSVNCCIAECHELICLCFAVTVASASQRRAARSKRGLLELAGAIECSTGRSALAYMMYGCYCGLGGQGWPRDRADWWVRHLLKDGAASLLPQPASPRDFLSLFLTPIPTVSVYKRTTSVGGWAGRRWPCPNEGWSASK